MRKIHKRKINSGVSTRVTSIQLAKEKWSQVMTRGGKIFKKAVVDMENDNGDFLGK